MSARAATVSVTGQVGHARRAAHLVDLVQQVGRGDSGAFANLYDETSPSVYGIALSMVRSPQLANSLIKEVYTEAWQRAARYDPSEGNVLAWLMSMAHRHFAERVRTMGSESLPERSAVLNGDRGFDRVGDDGSRPDAEPADRALLSLSSTSRDALKLAYFRGYSQTEVARILGLPLDTVKSSIRDGLVALRVVTGAKP
jgi:RNA polymerase sigma-70 factor, ECF subfamily